MNRNLKGKSISIIFTEPWDFVTQIGDKPLNGTILEIGISKDYYSEREAIFIKMNDAINYKNSACQFFIAIPRQSKIGMFENGKAVGFAVTCVDENSKDVFDLSAWRGGIAGEATIKIDCT